MRTLSIHADKRPPAGPRRAARAPVRGWLAVVTSALLISGAALWDTIRVHLFDVPSRAAFEAFLDETGQRATFDRFTQFLVARGVGDVVPTWQLWRQGIDWRALGASPFAVPPQDSWGHMVPTLAVVRDLVIPVVGAVDVVSGYRTHDYNARAGGAQASRHITFDAVDLVPRGFATRFTLQPKLLHLWWRRGKAVRLGLGLYGGTRFHIDARRHRRW